MLRLGMRLSVGGGRPAMVSAVLTALTVALGAAFVLVGLSISPALQARADRAAWTQMDLPDQQAGTSGTVTVSSSVSYVGSNQVRVVTVAAPDAQGPLPPGVPQMPTPGQAYVSPAVAELLEQNPQVAGRYGEVAGMVGPRSLRGPDDLLVVRGAPVDQAALDGVTVTSFPHRGPLPELSGVEKLALALGSLALAAPVALLVSISVQLNATTRQRRRSALDLVGATPAQLTAITIGEVLVPVMAGAVLGPLVFAGLLPLVARVPFEGTSFYQSDLSPGLATTATVLAAVVGVCLLGAVAGSRTVVASGVPSRRQPTPRKAVWVRGVAALLLALLACLLLAVSSRAATVSAVAAFACALAALTLSGPALVRWVGAGLERLPGVAALLAGRRLREHPRQVLRPISGVGVAVLVTVMFAAITPAAARSLDRSREVGQQEGTAQASVPYVTTAAADDLVRLLARVDGVLSPTTVKTAQVTMPDGALRAWIGDCAGIAAATRMNGLDCGSTGLVVGADAAAIITGEEALELYDLDNARPAAQDAVPDSTEPDVAHVATAGLSTMTSQPGVDMPDVIVDPALLDIDPGTVRPTLIVFAYTTSSALETARTLVESRAHSATVATRETTFEGFSQDARRLYDAVGFGAVALGVVSACTLIVAAAAGLIERRRSYTILRTAGSRLRTLQASVVLEGAVPVLVFGLVCAVVGVAMGWALTPGNRYPLAGVVSPVLWILVVAVATFSLSALLVGPLTRSEETRTE